MILITLATYDRFPILPPADGDDNNDWISQKTYDASTLNFSQLTINTRSNLFENNNINDDDDDNGWLILLAMIELPI